jgi:glycosyltransferase involved in cell wall biosynthesis
METVSIALCTFNGGRFIAEQLRSFSEQTVLPDELVICDDGSIDETLSVVESFTSKAPFEVRIFKNQQNLGSTKNFEKAIGLCSGDVIFLSDQDDIWLPEKIATMRKRFENDPDLALVFSDALLVDEHLKPLKRALWEMVFPAKRQAEFRDDRFKTLLWQNVVTGAATAFRSRYREKFLPIPNAPGLIHDGWIALVLASVAKVDYLPAQLLLYRQHGSQQLGVGISDLDAGRDERLNRSLTYNRSEIGRLQAMREIAKGSDIFPPETLSLVDKYLSERESMELHYRARLGVSGDLFTRLGQVATEYRSGRYSRFSRGLGSAAKDLLRK